MHRPDFLQIKKEFKAELNHSKTYPELKQLRIKYLGRKGIINQLIKDLTQLPPQDKINVGNSLNQLKAQIVQSLQSQRDKIQNSYVLDLDQDWTDVSIPGIRPNLGHLHPQTIVLGDVIDVFKQLGYQVAMGPEIESEEYNFAKLNFPPEHPARDAQNTLFLNLRGTRLKPGSVILRTHTSAMQGRIMTKTKPPIRVIVPGKCYRYETVDASHGFEFMHVEGFVVEKRITLADLFGTIDASLKMILGAETEVRFACTFFPFVEPGVDTYIKCTLCQGKGCSFCKETGWSEIMPAGMIHPNVFKAVGYNPDQTQGFAFAIGFSRVVNLRYGISDLRLLQTPDLRILNQF